MGIRVKFNQCIAACQKEALNSCRETGMRRTAAIDQINDSCRSKITDAFNQGIDGGLVHRENAFDGSLVFKEDSCNSYGRSLALFYCGSGSGGPRYLGRSIPQFMDTPANIRQQEGASRAKETKPARPNGGRAQKTGVTTGAPPQAPKARPGAPKTPPTVPPFRGSPWRVPEGIVPGMAPADVPAR